MAEYVLSKLAERDLFNISRYSILKFGSQRARQYKNSLKAGMRSAANAPSIGRPYTTAQGAIYQQYNVGRHGLFYRATEDGIFIVRVLHLMMDYDRHLD